MNVNKFQHVVRLSHLAAVATAANLDSILCLKKNDTDVASTDRYGNIRDHKVLPATRQRWHSRLYPSQLRLVLDLATPEGCKAELT